MRYILSAVVLAGIMTFGNAQATQIVNEDSTDYTVVVGTPDGQKTVVVAGGQVVEDVCPEGCSLLIGDSGEIIATPDDTITIKGGNMSLDD